ncbi:MAG: MFS transporter [Oscillospiraceae bacterium]|jgi:MFS family permease|nr:MFS transporter [Oscillospiraceae bacterium]
MNKTGKRKIEFTVGIKIILMFGIISFFGDAAYESARGNHGQYMALLGIDIVTVSLIAGIGEFIAYAVRIVSGIWADKTRRYWPFVFAGYGLIISVPLTGLIRGGENAWIYLLVFIMMERIGKALRSPAKDTIISTVAEGEDKLGTGFAFGWQEALDRAGAAIGPLLFTVVFMITGKEGLFEYSIGYILLGIPFALLLITVGIVYAKVKKAQIMETRLKAIEASGEPEKLPAVFWTYCAFTFFSLIGFVTFTPIGFYLTTTGLFTGTQIPMLYSVAMATNAVLAVFIGIAYDKIKKKTKNKHSGLLMLVFVPFVSALFPFLFLSNSIILIVIGFLVYGIILATHSTIMRASIADVVSLRKRGTGYGIFNTSFGLALMTGSIIFGYLITNFDIIHVRGFTICTQVIALIIFAFMKRQIKP